MQQSYTPTIDLAFSIPSFDEMMPVSFGTFIASINTCLKILQEVCTILDPLALFVPVIDLFQSVVQPRTA